MADAPASARPSPGNTRVGLYAMAVATGIAVANIYYNQPMLGLLKADFPQNSAAVFVPTATQLGYALGLFFLLPLGDLLQRRRLIIAQFVILSLASICAAAAPTPWLLVLASVALGACATVAQQIVPFAAHLASPEKRGAAIGTVMAGLLSGILFSRTIAGFVAEHAGWREMYWLGAPLALVAAALMFAVLPSQDPVSPMPYFRALRSLRGFWRRERDLRIATFVQAALFASFTAFWTILALYLAGPQFGLGADIAGLFGIVGAVGIFAAPLAGRVADMKGPHFVVWSGVILVLAAWCVFGFWASLVGLVVGVIVLDFGAQATLISNQHIVYALDAEARSRLNTIFTTGMFIGAATGSALATIAWEIGAWSAVCVLGATMGLIALAVRLLSLTKSTERR